ncbi:LysR family transcriptional regulator [Streptomyces sp. DT24]|uniref:LysR family transcriptional regulator n=1 Tax=unclassified Streptomyces TaxID=2593676 RepID=UPI003CE675DC
MELQHLRGFREVARELSFTQAARNLYCAQSTLTGHIKLLEASLGAELFRRRGRLPLELTDAGRVLLPRAEEILRLLPLARCEVAAVSRPPTRRLAAVDGPGIGRSSAVGAPGAPPGAPGAPDAGRSAAVGGPAVRPLAVRPIETRSIDTRSGP